jgi:O-antigen/teichoic acid export membrane protein
MSSEVSLPERVHGAIGTEVDSPTITPLRISKLRLHPFFTDVFLTGITQGSILFANLLIVTLISKWIGLVALGEYLLLKRVSTWLLTGTQLGLGVALPREIAHIGEDAGRRSNQYFAAAFLSLIPLLLVFGVAAILAANTVALLCFGSQNVSLVYALLLLLAGSSLQSIVFGYYRGLQRMRFANFVQLGGLVVVPLLCLAASRNSGSATLLVEITGIGTAAISIMWATPILLKARTSWSRIVPDARKLLSFGIVRVPADIASGALLTLGPVLISHYTNGEQLSFMLLGVTCLSMTGLAFWPVVMMLLAKVSRLLAAGRSEDVKLYIQHLRSAVIQLSLLIMTQVLIFIGPLVRWWLGESYLPGVPVICTLMASIPAFMYYYATRSVLDAASPTPYNTRNLVVALAVFCAVSLAVIHAAPRAWVTIGVSAAMTVAFYVLAIATDRSLRAVKLVDRGPELHALWTVGILGAVSLTVQFICRFEIGKVAFSAVELFNIGFAVLLTRRSQPAWLTFVSRVALSRA